MQMRSAVLVVATIMTMAGTLAGCVDRGGKPEKSDPAYVAASTLKADPTPKYPVNADLGGKVVYLGCDIDKATLKPGEKFTVIHYWKVIEAPGSEWRVFTHVKGARKEDWINADGSKLRDVYNAHHWKAGEILRDEQVIALKPDWQSPHMTLHVGLYKKGANSTKDRMPVPKEKDDGENAVLVTRLTVGDVKTPPVKPPEGGPKPTGYVIRRASGPITIDGKADEPSWGTAQSTGPFHDADGSPTPVPPTQARLLYDDKNLYVYVDVTDADVFSSFKKPDDPLWKEDVIELFIDADKNGGSGRYVELQVNPNNAQFDSAWTADRAHGGKGDEKWTSGMVSQVVVDGTVGDRKDSDKGWHVEWSIPLEAVKGGDKTMVVSLPPKPGDTWRINFMRREKGEKTDGGSTWGTVSWAGDWHAVDRLMPVTFGDDKGLVPAAVPAPTPAPTAVPAPTPIPAPAPTPTPTPTPAPAAPVKPATP